MTIKQEGFDFHIDEKGFDEDENTATAGVVVFEDGDFSSELRVRIQEIDRDGSTNTPIKDLRRFARSAATLISVVYDEEKPIATFAEVGLELHEILNPYRQSGESTVAACRRLVDLLSAVPVVEPKLDELHTTLDAARDKLVEENNALREALIWCSGYTLFMPGGTAREAWLKICEPLLRKKS